MSTTQAVFVRARSVVDVVLLSRVAAMRVSTMSMTCTSVGITGRPHHKRGAVDKPPSTANIRILLPIPAAPTAMINTGSVTPDGSVNLSIDCNNAETPSAVRKAALSAS